MKLKFIENIQKIKNTLKVIINNSAHYDFVAFGAISQLTSYTFLKGSIDYKDSLQTNNYFNITALRNEKVIESNFLKKIDE